MKKIAFMAAICAAATLASCGNGDKLKEAQNENTELKGDLQETSPLRTASLCCSTTFLME